MFRGREMAHRNLGWEMMDRLVKDLGELVVVEIRPRQEGPNLIAILAPKKPGQPAPKPKPAAQPAAGSHAPAGSSPGHAATAAPRPAAPAATFTPRPAASTAPAGDQPKPAGE
jgi:translation initiation factor IF-3